MRGYLVLVVKNHAKLKIEKICTNHTGTHAPLKHNMVEKSRHRNARYLEILARLLFFI